MKYLVTGGAGFIGSNIVERLLELNAEVRVLDNFSTGKKENLKEFLDRIELIEGDIRNIDDVRRAVKSVDVVLHQAALPSVPRSINDPVTTNEVNVNGTLNMLEASRGAGVKRFIYASSSSIYGDNPTLPKSEDMIPNPLSPYAVSKMAAEKYCLVFYNIYGLETIALRYFNVFGPRQDPTSQYSAVIPKFIRAVINGERPVIYGDGEQSRDFTYVGNVVLANLLAAAANTDAGLVLNCACHGRISLNELVGRINVSLGKEIKPIYEKARQGDVKHSFASIEKAYKTINYKPEYSFEQGLAKTVEWYANRL